jgi:hypothetical protein
MPRQQLGCWHHVLGLVQQHSQLGEPGSWGAEIVDNLVRHLIVPPTAEAYHAGVAEAGLFFLLGIWRCDHK